MQYIVGLNVNDHSYSAYSGNSFSGAADLTPEDVHDRLKWS